MLNWLWFFLLGAGILYGAVAGNLDAVTEAAFSAAAEAVTMCIGLCGMICLWLGILKIAAESGLTDKLARLLSPLIARLFPGVPRNSAAFELIVMNISANLLGLGNAATPFGLKAMTELQKYNPVPERATAPMVTLLALNTAGITFLPTTVISLRMAAGSSQPASIILPTFLASLTGMLFAVALDAALRRKYSGR